MSGIVRRAGMSRLGVLALMASSLVALVAAACGGGDDPTPTSSAPTATSPAPTATSPSAPGETVIPPTPTPTTPPIPAWQLDWDAALEAAKQEGTVIVVVARAAYRTGAEEFQKVFPDIVVEAQVGRAAEERLVTEYGAGIHGADVGLAGASSAQEILRPAGLLGDTRAQFILPDVVGDENWIGTFDDYFCDNDVKTHVFCFWATRGGVSSFINTHLASKQEFSLDDLLRPENRGRWCLFDPRVRGSGKAWSTQVMLYKGKDFIRQLMETEPVISSDDRAMAADLIRDEYVFCAGVPPIISEFHPVGLGLHIEIFPPEKLPIDPEFAGVLSTCCGSGTGKNQIDGQYTAGIGGPFMLLEPPHPNASKIFLNWIASEQGSRAYLLGTAQQDRHCSARVDVQDLCTSAEKMEDGKALIDFTRTSTLFLRDIASDIAVEVFQGR